jgi:uncharacterized membrane protein
MNPDYRCRQALQMLAHFKAAKHALAACSMRFVSKCWPCATSFGKVRSIRRPHLARRLTDRLTMQLTPIIALHMSAALAAVATGPVVLWARKGRLQRPWLHRAFGYIWVTLMVITALSAVFIRDFRLPNIAGYTPIHLFIPLALLGLIRAFQALAKGQIALHQKLMTRTYINACLVAGAFTLLPSRFLGQMLWSNFY